MELKFFQKSVLIIGGLLVVCLILEAGLRLFYPQNFQVHPPGMYTLDPAVGYVLTPGFKSTMNRPEFQIDFSTNNIGLRGLDPRSPKANTFRILVLGDSQTWGFGVADNETYPVQLEKLLIAHYRNRNIQVLNGGVPGYGTADELAFLKSYGASLDPDLVIVQFLSVNDLRENLTPASTWANVVDGMLTTQGLPPESNKEAAPALGVRAQLWLKENSYLARLALDLAGYMGTRIANLGKIDELWGEDFAQEDAILGQQLLVEITRTSSELGARSLLLYTTGQAQVIQDTYDLPRSATVVANAAKYTGTPWIDLAKQMQQRADRHNLYYKQNGHWTPAGHRAVAEILTDEIIKLGIIASFKEQYFCEYDTGS